MASKLSPKIRLTECADIIGKTSKNMTLSLERVRAVKQHMVDKWIDDARIQTEGHGDKRPLVIQGSTEDRKVNRRVEFVVSGE